jgi:hypothetical protein
VMLASSFIYPTQKAQDNNLVIFQKIYQKPKPVFLRSSAENVIARILF